MSEKGEETLDCTNPKNKSIFVISNYVLSLNFFWQPGLIKTFNVKHDLTKCISPRIGIIIKLSLMEFSPIFTSFASSFILSVSSFIDLSTFFTPSFILFEPPFTFFYFQNELSVFKEKCEELVSKSHANWMVHIEKLEKEIKSKDQIINHLVSLESLTPYPNRNAVLGDTVTSPSLLETLAQSNQTGNSLETRKGIDFVKDIIKPYSIKENNDENNSVSNTCITSIKSS